MMLSGWILLVVSWGVIVGLCVFCVVKVLTTQRANIHAPLEIDTGDLPGPHEPGR
ncbi:MAG: hypothetical protein N2595_01040 [bacterium]|nr:hypothetical protein [bacterium]